MTQAGYNVTIQTYKFDYFAYTGSPVLERSVANANRLRSQYRFNPGQNTGTANASSLQPAGGIIIPADTDIQLVERCTASDFSGFRGGPDRTHPAGRVQLRRQVQNAQAAGASGVIIFNEGNPGRTAVLSGNLSDAAGNRSFRRFRSRSRPSTSATTSTPSTRMR